jgi:hypothetical protein
VDTLAAAAELKTDRPPYWLATLEVEVATFVEENKHMAKGAIEAGIMERFPRIHFQLLPDGGIRVTGWVVDIAPVEHAADQG